MMFLMVKVVFDLGMHSMNVKPYRGGIPLCFPVFGGSVFVSSMLICMILTARTCDSGPVINREDRILGGRYAEHGEWPSTVAVSFRPGRSSCGANILTPLTLLTACHCIMQTVEREEDYCMKNGTYADTRLVAGSISRIPYDFQGFQVRFVYHWFPHPKCARSEDSGEWLYDIAVIVLTEELIFNALVKPIKIPRDRTAFRKMVNKWQDEEKACQVAGWGFTAARVVAHGAEEALNASEYLKVLDMKLQTTDECLDYLCQWERSIPRYDCKQRYRFHGTDRICAVPRYHNNGSICGGDSGGPLKCDGYVIGVVSYGTRCSDLNAPIVFARVDAAMPFIIPFVEHPIPPMSMAVSKWSADVMMLVKMAVLLYTINE